LLRSCTVRPRPAASDVPYAVPVISQPSTRAGGATSGLVLISGGVTSAPLLIPGGVGSPANAYAVL